MKFLEKLSLRNNSSNRFIGYLLILGFFASVSIYLYSDEQPFDESEEFRQHLENQVQDQHVNDPIYQEPEFVSEKPSHPTDLFYQLRLTEQDCHHIRKLIKNMTDLSVSVLLNPKKVLEMKKLGDKIRSAVHPLRFIGYIVTTPSLKSHLKKIRENSFKWGQFKGGFGDRMTKEFENCNLEQYIPGFGQLLGLNPADIKRYISNKDWDGLLVFLLK